MTTKGKIVKLDNRKHSIHVLCFLVYIYLYTASNQQAETHAFRSTHENLNKGERKKSSPKRAMISVRSSSTAIAIAKYCAGVSNFKAFIQSSMPLSTYTEEFKTINFYRFSIQVLNFFPWLQNLSVSLRVSFLQLSNL